METEIWKLIQDWRDRQFFRVSQASLADRVGVTRSALSQWKLGKATPTPEKLRRLATITGIPYSDLLRALLVDLGYLEREEPRHGTQERQPEAPPMSRAGVSPADDDPKPPTEEDFRNSGGYGLAANTAPRERAFDDQTEGIS